MERENRKFARNSRAHLLLGIILVLLGVAVMAEIFDAVPWRMRNIIFSWQMILIVLGVIFISGNDNKSTGYILLGIGAFFILPRFFDVPHYWRSLFWPSLLILVGLLILFGRTRRSQVTREKSEGDDLLDDVDIFGGSEKVLHSQNFKGGKISNIFGGSKYDMRQAKLAEGTNILEVSMIFGGSKFIVPEDWDVKMEVTTIFGGFSDKRHRSIVVPDANRKLIIRGEAIFGGGELTNF
jgi:predicted membrane protein